MSDDEKLLREIALQLYKWANESEKGGWPTIHVDAQRKLASKIHEHLVDKHCTDQWCNYD